jgi:hypothetical protein
MIHRVPHTVEARLDVCVLSPTVERARSRVGQLGDATAWAGIGIARHRHDRCGRGKERSRELAPQLDVVAAVPADGHAEIVLTVHGCRAEPCLVMGSVSREGSDSELRQSVSDTLREHLRQHAQSDKPQP